MPIFKIQHITRYEYDRPVRESANQVKIYPYPHPGLEIISHIVSISGEPLVSHFTDHWGNTTGLFMVDAQHERLEIDSRLVLKMTAIGPSPLSVSKVGDWEIIRQEAENQMRLIDLCQPEAQRFGEAIRRIVQDLRPNWDAPAMFIQRCSEYIYTNFRYQKGITTVETTVDEIMEHQSGVCQDFAHLLLEMLRQTGIPARYVSGYICPNRDGLRGVGATHAWVEAWLPASGWVGIDPTNSLWTTDQHIVLAVGRHFADCTPVKGAFKGPANQKLSIHVSVGYEDGATFEESNSVQMTFEPIAPKIEFEGAQQQ